MEGLTRRPLLVQIGSDARAGVDASSHGGAVVSALLATTSKPTEQARGRLLPCTRCGSDVLDSGVVAMPTKWQRLARGLRALVVANSGAPPFSPKTSVSPWPKARQGPAGRAAAGGVSPAPDRIYEVKPT
jgi:hypothetical protein